MNIGDKVVLKKSWYSDPSMAPGNTGVVHHIVYGDKGSIILVDVILDNGYTDGTSDPTWPMLLSEIEIVV